MKIIVTDVMPELRRQARDQVEAIFNRLALLSLHRDLVGHNPDDLLSREARRQQMLSAIEQATTPAALAAVIDQEQ